jgi:hypothetical protein
VVLERRDRQGAKGTEDPLLLALALRAATRVKRGRYGTFLNMNTCRFVFTFPETIRCVGAPPHPIADDHRCPEAEALVSDLVSRGPSTVGPLPHAAYASLIHILEEDGQPDLAKQWLQHACEQGKTSSHSGSDLPCSACPAEGRMLHPSASCGLI